MAEVAALARQSGIAIGAGWLERAEDGRLFNSYALCMPDGACPVHRKLHAFEHPLIHCGDRYTVADIMFYCFMAFRAPDGGSNLPAGCDNLAAWFDRVKVRPAAQATNGD